MRYKIASVLLLLALLSMGVAAEFVRATRFVYHQPERQYPQSACAMVEASVASPSCYRDGINLCRRLNSGKCFADCARNVHSVCIDTVRRTACELPAGWELRFMSRQECLREAARECDRICLFGRTKADCRRQAYTRCSYIGRIFV